jgi:NADPH-dependent 2,4-dienoyl-CoA reductase/sulfur reductase-like enzyme
MDHYQYIIVGGGMTADSAIQGIRELDKVGSIGIFGEDPNPPYNRPPLSKGLWKGKPLDTIWRKTKDASVAFNLGQTVITVNPQKKTIQTIQGLEYSYGKLLLATGGSPRKLPFGGNKILYFRNLDDYLKLREASGKGKRFGIIGGGFIGSEIAASLAMNGENVTMFFPEAGIGSRIYPLELSEFMNDFYRSKGVDVLTGQNVIDIKEKNDTFLIVTEKEIELPVDFVIAGIGITPNTELARAAGLQIGNGIVVDHLLRTTNHDIYAAGDVAEFIQPDLEKRIRLEHEDNANSMGKQAGRNMAGANEPYNHLSYFYSDMFELGFEAVGELDPRMETFMDWKEPFKKGVIYYLSDGRVRGVLLWNTWDSVPAARALIAEPGPIKVTGLKNRLG